MSNSSKAGASVPWATQDGEVPGVPSPATPTDFVASPGTKNARPGGNTDLIANPLGAQDVSNLGIRDFTAEQGPSPSDMLGPDHDVRPEDGPITGGKGIQDAFDPAARGVGSLGSPSVPFKALERAERGSR